jgi:hypothetical protein
MAAKKSGIIFPRESMVINISWYAASGQAWVIGSWVKGTWLHPGKERKRKRGNDDARPA